MPLHVSSYCKIGFDGATIVKALHIDNPTAPRVLVDISKV